MIRLVVFLMMGVKAWMLVDAYRRKADTYWLWIIIGVPGGSLLYLFMVRLRDPDAQRIRNRVLSSLERPPSVSVLRRRYEESASVVNRLALAQGLGDAGRWAESKPHFLAVLEDRPEDADALFGLGVTELELGNASAAIAPLEKLIELSPIYRDFVAFPELADALYRAGQVDDCLDLLRGHAKRNSRLPHVVLLAQYLVKAGQTHSAHRELRRALERHEDAPRHVKREDRRWARTAKKMLTEAA